MTVKKDLSAAMSQKTLIRVEREELEADYLDGYVLNLSNDLMLFQIVESLIIFNGYVVVRMCDITSIEMPAPNFEFVEQALKLRGEKIEKPLDINLSSMTTVFTSAGEKYPLVTIHLEEIDSEICHVGRVVSADEKSLTLIEIAPNAKWESDPTTYSVTDITQVDFGGKYEDALHLVSRANG